jgi:hypothetical protein
MSEVENFLGSFKESISKRFEKQEENFKNLADKMNSFEEAQREYKKRLEDRRNADENEDNELQQVKNFIFFIFRFVSIL